MHTSIITTSTLPIVTYAHVYYHYVYSTNCYVCTRLLSLRLLYQLLRMHTSIITTSTMPIVTYAHVYYHYVHYLLRPIVTLYAIIVTYAHVYYHYVHYANCYVCTRLLSLRPLCQLLRMHTSISLRHYVHYANCYVCTRLLSLRPLCQLLRMHTSIITTSIMPVVTYAHNHHRCVHHAHCFLCPLQSSQFHYAHSYL